MRFSYNSITKYTRITELNEKYHIYSSEVLLHLLVIVKDATLILFINMKCFLNMNQCYLYAQYQITKKKLKRASLGELPGYPLKMVIKSFTQRNPFISVSKNKMNIPYFTIVKISMTAAFSD